MCWRRGIRAHSYLTSSTPLFHRYRLDSIYLCYSSHCIVQLVTLLPILLTCLLCMASSHLKRKLLRCPSSLPAAWSRRSRERWSRASRGCGSAQGGSRASGASPALVRRCRSCCAAQPNMRLQTLFFSVITSSRESAWRFSWKCSSGRGSDGVWSVACTWSVLRKRWRLLKEWWAKSRQG